MADAKTTPKSAPGGSAARIRTAGEGSPGGSPARPSTPPRKRPSAPRSGAKTGGPAARLLAPLALVICAIAVFSVLSSGGSDAPSRGDSAEQSSGAAEDSGDSASGDSTGESAATEPVRSTYRVKPGDSFAAIAEKTGVDVDKLAELNPDVDPRALQPGQKLKLK